MTNPGYKWPKGVSGNPLGGALWKRPWLDRFNESYERLKPDECWPWNGRRDPGGYGKFFRDGHDVGAHKIALEIKLGRPLKECALHTCDNNPCVNGAHLYEGTQKQNAADRENRGRGNHATGDRNGARKRKLG